MTQPALTSVAVYRRTVKASEERVWENVRDWEHLPWLHRGSFSSIECLESGDQGWRARIGTRLGGEILLELVIEPDEPRYVSRTLEGNGAGTEIWTRVTPAGAESTDIEVEFFVPDAPPEKKDRYGAGFVALYTDLWDEDEAMMVHRAAQLASLGSRPERGAVVELGPLEAVRAKLPLSVDFGGRTWRVIELDGELLAFAPTCPHMLGPLGDGEIEDGRVTCPWHGYRFDLRTAKSCDGRGLRLLPAPRVEVDMATGAVRIAAQG